MFSMQWLVPRGALAMALIMMTSACDALPPAKTLDLSAFPGRVQIETTDVPDIRITLEGGRASLVEQTRHGAAIKLAARLPRAHSTVIHGGSVTVVQVASGSNVIQETVIGGDGRTRTVSGTAVSGELPRVRVQMPRDASIVLGDFAGEAEIDAWPSGATLDWRGNGDVRIGYARDLKLRHDGSGTLTIDSVSGTHQLTLSGSGDVRMIRGTLERLKLAHDGAGDFEFRGEAITAEVEASGSGDVSIATCRTPTVVNRGSGDVRCGRAHR